MEKNSELQGDSGLVIILIIEMELPDKRSSFRPPPSSALMESKKQWQSQERRRETKLSKINLINRELKILIQRLPLRKPSFCITKIVAEIQCIMLKPGCSSAYFLGRSQGTFGPQGGCTTLLGSVYTGEFFTIKVPHLLIPLQLQQRFQQWDP